MLYLGIDPGLKGGISYICSKSNAHYSLPMPDAHEFSQLIADWNAEHGIKHCFLEMGQAMPKQGVTSMFNYGRHNGLLEGILIANGISYTLVKPKEWQKEMFKGTKDKQDPKQRALEIVRRLFPKDKFIATIRCKKPHDGMIDSVLLAEFCRRKII